MVAFESPQVDLIMEWTLLSVCMVYVMSVSKNDNTELQCDDLVFREINGWNKLIRCITN
jgi:hypothetical protein